MPAVTWDTVGLYRDDKSSSTVPYIVEKCNINKKINKRSILLLNEKLLINVSSDIQFANSIYLFMSLDVCVL